MTMPLDPGSVPTPCFVCDLSLLECNLRLLADVQARAGCRILLALKGFAMWSTFPLLRRYLHGVAASGLHEALLGHEHFGREVHVYSPAFAEYDFARTLEIADHVVFNSLSQWERLRPLVKACGREVRCGIRINPEHSEVQMPLYDPCSPKSRLGVTAAVLGDILPEGMTGLHFHTLCELGADALDRTLAVVEDRFPSALARAQWVNFGGGLHITRPGFDVDRLVDRIRRFRATWDVEVYLEPGEAVALDTGVLVSSVLDIVENGMPIAILDTSATAHMPDVLEMPYRPEIVGAGKPGEHPHCYRLGGSTCLAGDVIGDYSFPRPLEVGDKLVFRDMAHYSMVKTTTFNGLRLPSIATFDPRDGGFRMVREYDYDEYRRRLS